VPDTTASAFGHGTANTRGRNVVCGVKQQLILQTLSTEAPKGERLKAVKKFSHSESTAASQRPRGSAQKSRDHTAGCRQTQNHRMVGAGRDLCGSSSPTPLPKQGLLQQAAQDLVCALPTAQLSQRPTWEAWDSTKRSLTTGGRCTILATTIQLPQPLSDVQGADVAACLARCLCTG